MNILPEIQHRFTPHSFLPDPLAEGALDRILEAGRLAPSAKNRQPWRFIVIEKTEIRERIGKAAYQDERIMQAPVIIAACSANKGYIMPNGQEAYPIDISIASSFMVLQARHEGLECAFLTTFEEAEMKRILTVPYGMRVVMLLLIGYSGKNKSVVNRLDLSRIVSFNHW